MVFVRFTWTGTAVMVSSGGTREGALRSSLGSVVPCSQQSSHKHGIVSHSGGRIDHGIQQLIIPGSRHCEGIADRLVFASAVPGPVRLECEHGAVAVRQHLMTRD